MKAKQNGLIEPSILKDRTREIFNKLNQKFRAEYNTKTGESLSKGL